MDPREATAMLRSGHGSADSHGGKPKVDKIAKPTAKYEASVLLRGEGMQEKRSRIPFRRGEVKTKEPIELSGEIVDRYRGFMTDHIRTLQRLQARGSTALASDKFSHERELIRQFVDAKGNIKNNAIDEFLRDESGKGIATAVQLLEHQTSMKALGNAIAMGTFFDHDQDNTSLVQVFSSYKGDPAQVDYLKELTGIDLNAIRANSRGDGLELVNPNIKTGAGGSLQESSRILKDEIKRNRELRDDFLRGCGLDPKKFRSYPEHGLTARLRIKGAARHIGGYEQIGLEGSQFLGHSQVNEIFDQMGGGIRDVHGFSGIAMSDNPLDMDYVGNLKRYSEARVLAMTMNLQEHFSQKGESGWIAELQRIRSDYADDGRARKEADKKFTEQEQRLGEDKKIHVAALSELHPYNSGFKDIVLSEISLRNAVSRIAGSANADEALERVNNFLTGHSGSLEISGNPPVTLDKSPVLIQDELVKAKGAARDRIRKSMGYDEFNRSDARDKEIEERASADSDVRKLAVELERVTKMVEPVRDDLVGAINGMDEARKKVSISNPEDPSRAEAVKKANETIDLYERDYDTVVGFQTALAGLGVSGVDLPGFDDASLGAESVDDLNLRANRAREAAKNAYALSAQGFNAIINAQAFALDAADLASKLKGMTLTGIDEIWIASARRVADQAAAENPPPSLGDVYTRIRQALDGEAGVQAARIGWTEDENNDRGRRDMLGRAKAASIARKREETDPRRDNFKSLSGVVPRAELASLSQDEITDRIRAHLRTQGVSIEITDITGAAITIDSTSDLADAEIQNAIQGAVGFAREKSTRLAAAIIDVNKGTDKEIEEVGQQKGKFDVEKTRKKIDTTVEVMKRQSDIIQSGYEFLRRINDAEYTGVLLAGPTRAQVLVYQAPSGPDSKYTGLEQGIDLDSGGLFYLRMANILTGEHFDSSLNRRVGGYMDQPGQLREDSLRQFMEYMPPSRMLELMKESFGIPGASNLGELAEDFAFRCSSQSLDAIRRPEMTRGLRKFVELLYEESRLT